MQIKDMHFSKMINKVENTNILLKFQSGHTISILASIRDILANSCNRPIENNNLFVNDKKIQILSANTLCHMARPMVILHQS
jgi:hypothetical protein